VTQKRTSISYVTFAPENVVQFEMQVGLHATVTVI